MIISGFNASPETLVSGATERLVDKLINKSYNTDYLKRDNVCMMANGATFRRDVKGVFPLLIDKYFLDRKFNKDTMLKIRKEVVIFKVLRWLVDQY